MTVSNPTAVNPSQALAEQSRRRLPQQLVLSGQEAEPAEQLPAEQLSGLATRNDLVIPRNSPKQPVGTPKLGGMNPSGSQAMSQPAPAGQRKPASSNQPTPASQLRAVDLFCGSGGLSQGLLAAGVEVVAAYDHWEASIETYRLNLGDHAQLLDLTDVEAAVYQILPLEVDLIAGGPPCQDFSSAGNRVEANQASLTLDFAQIVKACQPRFLLMENVPRARHSQAYHNLKQVLSEYEFMEVVLDASFCGVPQIRKRFFSFGALAGELPFLDWIDQHQSSERLTVKEYLADDIDIEHYYRHPRNYSRRAVFSVHEPSPTIRGVNRPIPPGYQGNHLDSAPVEFVRPLTSTERSRIQTFPKSWRWGAEQRKTEVELQIGNAVPPNLARFVGQGILHASS